MKKLKNLLKNSAGELSTWKLFVCMVVVTIVALSFETGVLISLNTGTCRRTMIMLSDQVTGILDNNSAKEEEMIASLKEEYIVRAKAVAHFLEYEPEAETDIEELVKLSNFLEIDEIHIFDNTGTIIHGTEPKYYGYSFDSGDQMAYFKPMLNNKSMSMCQDMMPNTAENKVIMYAITWNEDGTEMIQVGIQPTRLMEELKSNKISEVLNNIPQYEGYDIYVADSETTEIVGATDKNTVGSDLSSVVDVRKSDGSIILDNYTRTVTDMYFYCVDDGDNIVVITHSPSDERKNVIIIILIELIYLVIAAFIIMYVIRKLAKVNKEKESHLEVLKSLSDIYFSMHLLDLKTDCQTQFKAHAIMGDITDHPKGATQMMIDTMYATITEEYLEDILKFTDLTTIAERMKGKKIISKVVVGKNLGWTEFCFVTIEADDEGRPTLVMFTSRDVNAEKKKEIELIRNSITDELTDLDNRRAYEDEMNGYADKELPENLVYIAFDVNGLKTINDTLGHSAGDELIVGAAKSIKNAFGRYGNVYRIGGDEFIAIVNLDKELLEQSLAQFEEDVASWKGKYAHKLSVSYGCVTSEDNEYGDLREMSKLADHRMYQAKNEYYVENGIDRRRR